MRRAPWWQETGYDAYGNRWHVSGVEGAPAMPTAQGQYDAATNRIAKKPDNTLMPGDAYDHAGNLTDHLYMGMMVYDGEGRMVSDGGNTYAYGDGRRVKKTTNAEPTVYVYDVGGGVCAGGMVQCGTCYLTVDHLGSTRMVTDGAGVVKSRRDYFPFGEEVPANGTFGNRQMVTDGGPGTYNATNGPTLQFTGKERNLGANGVPTGLDYFGARYYSGAQGRFTSPDEFVGGPYEVGGSRPDKPGPLPYADITNPRSLNKYAYALNNPLRYIDPDGHEPAGQRLNSEQEGVLKTAARCLFGPIGCFIGALFDPPGVGEGSNPPTIRQALTKEGKGLALWVVIPIGGKAMGGAASELISSIGSDKALTRLAGEAGKSVQAGIDSLTKQLGAGNLKPGIGSKNLFGNISYARARDGARVFLRQVGDKIEILAKASKQNEAQVIKRLEELYKEKK